MNKRSYEMHEIVGPKRRNIIFPELRVANIRRIWSLEKGGSKLCDEAFTAKIKTGTMGHDTLII